MPNLRSLASALLAASFLSGCSGGGQEPTAVKAPAAAVVPAAESEAVLIDRYLSTTYVAGRPGATVIVVRNGETLLRKAYGNADVSRALPMTPDAVHRLGSLTKQFTAAGIMLLAQQGKLALDDDITRFLPQFPVTGKKISIEHLLTHTSGIANFTAQPDFPVNVNNAMTLAQMVQRIAQYPIQFEAGSRFAYSNSGYVLLGAIIEKASGKTYADFMAQDIFEPLGLRDTAYEGHERRMATRAVGHTPAANGFSASAPISMSQPHAAGALVSTVDDMALWDQAISTGKLLPPASWQKMVTPYRLADGTSSPYGYGFDTSPLFGSPAISHGGGITGFSTYALRLPDQKIYVAVLSNAESGLTAPVQVANHIAGLAMGKMP